MQLQDLAIDLDQITELEDSSVFRLEKLPLQFLERSPHFMMMLSFEINKNLDSIGRQGYNFIDMLSDIGGIQAIIVATFGLVLAILNHNYFDSYMAQKLYKIAKQK